MTELLPCPFCGSEAETFEASEDSFSILCTGCGVETPYLPYLTEAIAAWNRRADARQLALKTRVCPMCEDCPDGCPVETPKDSRNIVTNADRIRAMSVDELAAMMYSFEGLEMPYNYCQRKKECDDILDSGTDIPDEKCIGCLIDWLRQPAETEGTE